LYRCDRLTTGETFYWNDVTISSDTVMSTKTEKNKEEVLGLKCDAITEVQPMKLDDVIFNLPKGAPTEKSPF